MRPFVRTRFAVVVLAVVVLGAGCGGRKAPGDGVVEITFWHSFVSTTQPALQALLRDFEAAHPGIRVRAQYSPTGDGLIQKLVTSIQSGTAPDVSWVHADFLGRLAEARAIYPMAHFVDGPDGLSAEEMADVVPGLLQAATYRDTLYAMPMEATLLALFYNRDRFRQAGLDPDRPPQTWDELRACTERLTRDDDGDGKMDRYGFYVPSYPASGPLTLWTVLQWTPYLWQAGGTFVDATQTEVLFDSEAGVQALALWKQLYDAQRFQSNSMSHDLAFASGWMGMIMEGPWDLPRFRQMTDVDWAVAPLPAGPAAQVTYLAGEHLAIFRQSAHPEAAWTFVRYVLQPEVQAKFSRLSGYLPVRRSTLDLPEYRAYLETDPALRSFVEQLPLGRPRPPVDRYHVEINQYLAEAIEQVLVGGADPQAALAAAADRSNRLLGSGPVL